MQKTCKCRTVTLDVEGKTVEGVVEVDGDCRWHGLPSRWPEAIGKLGHLFRHARWIQVDRHVGGGAFERTITIYERRESPREVEARLLAEAAGAESRSAA